MDTLVGGENERCVPEQAIPEWEGVWEGLGRCLQWFSPAAVWQFTPEELWRPAEVAENLKASCLIYTETAAPGTMLGPGLHLLGLPLAATHGQASLCTQAHENGHGG